jgi:hypothetical protein
MRYFIKIDCLNEESVKINLELVLNVELSTDSSGHKKVTVYYIDGSHNTFTEGINVKDIKSVYNKFPC